MTCGLSAVWHASSSLERMQPHRGLMYGVDQLRRSARSR